MQIPDIAGKFFDTPGRFRQFFPLGGNHFRRRVGNKIGVGKFGFGFCRSRPLFFDFPRKPRRKLGRIQTFARQNKHLEAGTDRYKGAVAALYKLNSDLKGNVIVCTKMPIDSVSEASQAELLPRTYLVALANGVERIFWYKSHSRETRPDEREAHFGILRKDYSPKPSFDAYRTLTRLCPSGSTVPELRRSGSVYLAGWTRPDGVKTWAIWTTMYPEKIRLDIRGSLSDTQNHLGGKLPPPEAEFTVGPGPLYLIGPESVTFR